MPGFSDNASDLLRGLLTRDPEKRLNVDQIMAHPFFEGLNFDDLLERKIKPPFVPKVKSETDISNIDTDFTD